jgi:hypothetical protein
MTIFQKIGPRADFGWLLAMVVLDMYPKQIIIKYLKFAILGNLQSNTQTHYLEKLASLSLLLGFHL